MTKTTKPADGILTPVAEAELLVTDGGIGLRATAVFDPAPTPWHPQNWASIGGIAINPAVGQIATLVR